MVTGHPQLENQTLSGRGKALLLTTKTIVNPVQSSPTHKCDICNKMFTTKQSKDRHMNTHTGAKPFECKQCHKRFVANSVLWRHKKAHSATQFKCPFCQQKFSRPDHCRTHWKGNKHPAIGCKVRLSQLTSGQSSNSFSSEKTQMNKSSTLTPTTNEPLT